MKDAGGPKFSEERMRVSFIHNHFVVLVFFGLGRVPLHLPISRMIANKYDMYLSGKLFWKIYSYSQLDL